MQRIFVLFLALLSVVAFCATKHSTVVSLGYKTGKRFYEIPTPKNHYSFYIRGAQGENTVLVLNKDSFGIYISNYWYFPNNYKLDTTYYHPAFNLENDSLFFSGIDKKGHWRHIETSKMNYGYFGIKKEELPFYDSLLTEVKSKKHRFLP